MTRQSNHDRRVDAVVVGAGFGGLYAAYTLRRAGLEVKGFERASDVGGTWFWNRYPGARCDVESLEYSYQFSDELQQAWSWSERYATQPEILAYAGHVADRFDLRSLYSFETGITAASFHEQADRWVIETDTATVWEARYLILATGGVSVPATPDIPGQDRFGGTTVHTGAWPQEGVDLADKRVAIIGTGGSGVQALPVIADVAAEVSVLQRTPTYVVPARNRSADADVERVVKAGYDDFRRRNADLPFGFGAFFDQSEVPAFAVDAEERHRRYLQRWQDGGYSFLYTFGDLGTDAAAAETAAEFIRGEIRRTVDDPEVAEALCPQHVFGCRRIVIGTDYYESFNRANVSLVDVAADPIAAITETGVRTEGGHLDVDVIVFATGFDDQAASLRRLDLAGIDGTRLADVWEDRPQTFLGLCVAGFPNLFFVNGPGSPSITTNMIANIEHTVGWIVECIGDANRRGYTRVEADPAAQQSWTDRVDARADGRLLHACSSRYVGVTKHGERYVYPYIGVPDYRASLAAIAAEGYPGLRFSTPQVVDPEPAGHPAVVRASTTPRPAVLSGVSLNANRPADRTS